MKKIINSENAPQPVGPYSHSIKASSCLLFISGQLGLDINGILAGNSIESQTRQALINIGEILKSSGLDYENVVKITIMIKNINDFNKMNEVYNEFFDNGKPARSAFETTKLPKDGLIEIDAIAVFND